MGIVYEVVLAGERLEGGLNLLDGLVARHDADSVGDLSWSRAAMGQWVEGRDVLTCCECWTSRRRKVKEDRESRG